MKILKTEIIEEDEMYRIAITLEDGIVYFLDAGNIPNLAEINNNMA